MSDDEFWKYIDALGGVITTASVDSLAQELRGLSLKRLIGFQDVFDRKLFELDSPGNTVTYPGEPGVINGEASLAYRTEIIARGREEFEKRVAQPRAGGEGDGRSEPEILYVFEDLTDHPLPPKRFPISTGSNPDRWPDAAPLRVPAAPPAREAPSPGPFSQRVQLERLQLLPTSSGVLIGFVAYAIVLAQVREIMGCVMAHTIADARAEVIPFLQALLRDGETLYPRVLVGTTDSDGVNRGFDMVQFERKSDLELDDYIELYYRGRQGTAHSETPKAP